MKGFFFTEQKKTQYKLFAGDVCVIAFSIFLAYCIRIFLDGHSVSLAAVWDRIHYLSWSFFLLYPLVLYIVGFYSPNQKTTTTFYFLKLTFAVVIAVAFAAMLLFFVPRYLIGRKVLMLQLPFLILFFYTWRLSLFKVINRNPKTDSICVIGKKPLVSSFMKEVELNPGYTIKQFSIVDSDTTKENLGNKYEKNEIYDIILNNNFKFLAIDSTLPLKENEINAILDFRFNKQKNIYDLVKLYENLTGKVPVQYIDGRWFISNIFFQGQVNQAYFKSKRLFDIICSSFLLLVLLPLMLLISVLIKISSKGPVFYTQQRIGMDRTPFRFYKFRTMIDNAEAGRGPQPSQAKDPRLTLIGTFLRKARLDEIPQLINILKGEMSFIGPRPIRAYFADQYTREIPFYELRHNVKPGLTGWAQVHGCYAVPYGQEALQYELFYIQHMSVVLDIHIIFKTLRTVFRGEGK